MLAKESVCEHVYFGPNSPEETENYFMVGQHAGDDVLFGLLREECPLDLEEMTSRFHPTT